MAIWLAYFKTQEDRDNAYREAKIDAIPVLVIGYGGKYPDSKLPFIVFNGEAQEIAFFIQNGAVDVHALIAT